MIFTNHKSNRLSFAICIIFLIWSTAVQSQETGIRPYTGNPSYWEFKNRPVLLIGGSDNDNLFQSDNVYAELDKIKAAGGNYIRCTLSCSDPGDEWPFWRSGLRFNLNKFNPEFWKSLDAFFKLTAEREIIVQLEIWDFHDFTAIWDRNPWNPVINNVFTTENTKLKEHYINSQSLKHDFFFSVPKLNNDELLLRYQKMFVDQLLSISFNYNHILYCITNEIFPQYSPEWGWFWARYLKDKAAQAGVTIQVTELYQDEDITQKQHLNAQQHPEIYSFIEASPNSRVVGEKHWERLQKVRAAIVQNPRPVNNVKIYGGSLGGWTGGPEHGIQRFWRNLIGGAASARFHQPPEGIGISDRALAHIKSARMLVNEYNFFTSKPDVDFSMLQERKSDEAFLASNAEKDVVVYFPDGGQVVVDFTNFTGAYTLKWLNLEGANWYSEVEIQGEKIMELTTPFAGEWVAMLKKCR
jgi:hypothetical protein